MTTTRQKVLAYLRSHPVATANQIGRALSLSAPNVRHHLAVLAADGRVVQGAPVASRKRGRPSKLHRVSDALRGSNLAVLSSLLLRALLSRLPHAERVAAIHRLAADFSRATGQSDFGSATTGGVRSLVQTLTALHYEARWEAGAVGPRILFGNCPYSAIIKDHPELCEMDAAMLQQLTGLPATQTAKIGQGGSIVCCFTLAPKLPRNRAERLA